MTTGGRKVFDVGTSVNRDMPNMSDINIQRVCATTTPVHSITKRSRDVLKRLVILTYNPLHLSLKRALIISTAVICIIT